MKRGALFNFRTGKDIRNFRALQLPPAGVDCSSEFIDELHELLKDLPWSSAENESLIINEEGDMLQAHPTDWVVRFDDGEVDVYTAEEFNRLVPGL